MWHKNEEELTLQARNLGTVPVQYPSDHRYLYGFYSSTAAEMVVIKFSQFIKRSSKKPAHLSSWQQPLAKNKVQTWEKRDKILQMIRMLPHSGLTGWICFIIVGKNNRFCIESNRFSTTGILREKSTKSSIIYPKPIAGDSVQTDKRLIKKTALLSRAVVSVNLQMQKTVNWRTNSCLIVAVLQFMSALKCTIGHRN